MTNGDERGAPGAPFGGPTSAIFIFNMCTLWLKT